MDIFEKLFKRTIFGNLFKKQKKNFLKTMICREKNRERKREI